MCMHADFGELGQKCCEYSLARVTYIVLFFLHVCSAKRFKGLPIKQEKEGWKVSGFFSGVQAVFWTAFGAVHTKLKWLLPELTTESDAVAQVLLMADLCETL